MPNRIYYTCGTLDRAAIQRDDEAWVEGRRTGDGAFIVPVWRDKSLVVQGDNPEAGFVSGADARALVKLLEVAKPAKPISANGVLGLAEALKRKRYGKVTKFIVTDTKAEQVRQAKAMEDGRTGKSGFVAH